MNKKNIMVNGREVPVCVVHTLVIGSGAAGLNAAIQLRNQGIEDVLIISEGLNMGTSINTGSDKQTYYKTAMCGGDQDSPYTMARNYFDGGSMHGDLALVEASTSARAFLNLVNLGVPFPQDPYGQFVGYKTDHDPAQRATSIGPYTSREMCNALIRELKRQNISIHEKTYCVSLLTDGEGDAKRAVGAIAQNENAEFVAYAADNVVFAVGGPGGLYETSVYPNVHTGAIGIALLAGAMGQGLPEAQYGLASTKFRWNVSGTYMQVIPKFVSTEKDGESDPREFMRDYFNSVGEMNSMVFLKGYQWPFDIRKVVGGSSIIDVLVYIETQIKGRRVFLDFRENPQDFKFEDMSQEAYDYLKNSRAFQDTPLARLEHMNPSAISLYNDNNIDISVEMLEIAVCAQHNNGGLAANHWWESTNVKHLFPVGEVNGSHGVARPGGSALNSGQVGAFRASDYIAARYKQSSLDYNAFVVAAEKELAGLETFMDNCRNSSADWRSQRQELQSRMSRAAAHIRSEKGLEEALREAEKMWQDISIGGCRVENPSQAIQALRNRQLVFAHLVYINATLFQVKSGAGSRGSAMVKLPGGVVAHDMLDSNEWSFQSEDTQFRRKVLETIAAPDGSCVSRWVDVRPIPESELWFENAWADYRAGKIYG
ncbi:MAG: FAD-binding protein [Victivallales bacterium]|nr:FAD-binding protein [Victivallales bacterium]